MPTDKSYKELMELRDKLSEVVSALNMILEGAGYEDDNGMDSELEEMDSEGEEGGSSSYSEREEDGDSEDADKKRRKALVIMAIKKKKDK